MTKNDILIALTNAPARGIPTQAQKAYQRAAAKLVSILFDGRTPPLNDPPFGANHDLIDDIIEAEIVVQRAGALAEHARRQDTKKDVQ